MRLSAGRYHSFVVRVWSGEGAEATLRGQITHIASHQSAGFTDLERILAFIRAHLLRPEEDPSAPPAPPAPPEVPAAEEAPGATDANAAETSEGEPA